MSRYAAPIRSIKMMFDGDGICDSEDYEDLTITEKQ